MYFFTFYTLFFYSFQYFFINNIFSITFRDSNNQITGKAISGTCDIELSMCEKYLRLSQVNANHIQWLSLRCIYIYNKTFLERELCSLKFDSIFG